MLLISSLILIMAYAVPSMKNSTYLLSGMTISSLVLALVLSINTIPLSLLTNEGSLNILNSSLNVSPLTLLVDSFLLILTVLLFSTLPSINMFYGTSINNINYYINYFKDYLLVGIFSLIGSLLLIGINNIILLYLAIELQSFGVYILAAMNKNSEASTNAALKYFLLGSLASCVLLLGLIILYASTGLIYLTDIYNLYNILYVDMPFINLGIALIIIGLLFKIAAAPLHYWAPDVYSDTPTSITIWLTIMPKIALLILLYDLLNGFNSNGSLSLINLVLLSSALSLIIGSVLGLAQQRIKKLLAYSTISHVGFMLLIISINTEESTSGLLFYIIQYSLTNLLLFLIIIYISYDKYHNISSYKSIENTDINYIEELKDLVTKNYWLSISFIATLFSMAGIPPLPGFFAKQYVILSAAQINHYFMALLCIIVSVISATYYLKIVTKLYSTDELLNTNSISTLNNVNSIKLLNASTVHTYIISSLTLVLFLFIFNTTIILNITELVSLSIYG